MAKRLSGVHAGGQIATPVRDLATPKSAPSHRSQEIRMSRITHTARGAAVIAAVAVSALALSACSGSGDGGSTDGAVDTSRLTIGVDADMAPGGYDPLRYSAGQRMFYEGMYDSLFVIDESGAVVPDLVTKFEFSEDCTQMTLDLDTSATFPDGSTLSAELVKANLRRHRQRRTQRVQPVRRRAAERDHRRHRRRRRHRHADLRPASSRLRSEPDDAFRHHRRRRRAPPTARLSQRSRMGRDR